MLIVTNYAKNYASKIYQSLRPIRKSRVLAVVGVKENVSASRAFFAHKTNCFFTFSLFLVVVVVQERQKSNRFNIKCQ